jgi:hypothetical protein
VQIGRADAKRVVIAGQSSGALAHQKKLAACA